ncbi:MAG: Hsp20/alpha crystallin family protein [bacterium]
MANDRKELTKKEVQHPAEVERTQNRKVFVPKVDIFERGDDTILLADLPGVDEKSVDINLDKNVLTITGVVDAKKADGYRLAYAEYETGDYQRSFTLSNEINKDKIEATMKNGVLRLHLPKAEEAKPKKIAVKSG